jgi:NAD(P)-dependent dehydrogenase (short-subunit alcohol dehydrogenase family)
MNFLQNTLFDLSGRVAIVTGGGRGIGREIALTLARAGADVAIAEIETGAADSCLEEIRALGRRAHFVATDVRNSGSVEAMVDEVMAQLGQIDILVNNAGIARNCEAEETPDDLWLDILDVNLNGVFWCCRSVGKRMLKRGSGVIVSIASMSGIIVNKPQPQAAYNASKAGVIMLTKSLAAEWAPRGLRVNCVSPGYIGTEMTKAGMTNEEWRRTWLEMTPMGRVGEPEEIAHAVWYLASDAARFANGTNLVVDGAYTCW